MKNGLPNVPPQTTKYIARTKRGTASTDFIQISQIPVALGSGRTRVCLGFQEALDERHLPPLGRFVQWGEASGTRMPSSVAEGTQECVQGLCYIMDLI